jgi:hypothetical protein
VATSHANNNDVKEERDGHPRSLTTMSVNTAGGYDDQSEVVPGRNSTTMNPMDTQCLTYFEHGII